MPGTTDLQLVLDGVDVDYEKPRLSLDALLERDGVSDSEARRIYRFARECSYYDAIDLIVFNAAFYNDESSTLGGHIADYYIQQIPEEKRTAEWAVEYLRSVDRDIDDELYQMLAQRVGVGGLL